LLEIVAASFAETIFAQMIVAETIFLVQVDTMFQDRSYKLYKEWNAK
jgi:hypothetical protein